MAPVLNHSRETLPGNIKVTPIVIEPPINSRPVLQSHHFTAVITHTTTKPAGNHVNWIYIILFIFLTALLGVVLSSKGWTWITGRIWKYMSGYQGPLVEDEDEQHLLNENASEEPETPKEPTDVVVHDVEIPNSPPLSLESYITHEPHNPSNHPVLTESRICSPRPKTVIGNSIGTLETVDIS
jgi:hypothetical protein